MNKAYTKNVNSCLEEYNTSTCGLTKEKANELLQTNGKNELPKAKKLSPILKFLLQFKDIMIIILLCASIVSFVLGEYIDGGIILTIVLLNAILGFAQEFKAEKAMEGLKALTKSYSKVIRDGEVVKIKSDEIVIGDIIVLEAGDIVPADLRLIDTAMLKCDESSLTGESVSVLKNHNLILKEDASIGDRFNMAFSGSVVTYGRGTGIVVATGKNTELGKIADMLSSSKQDETPLQKSLKIVGRVITAIVLVVAVLTFLLEIFVSDVTSIKDALFTSIALAVAAIPESLPAIVTIIMALGIGKLAKKKAIIKKMHAIETLGCCEIICSDKTGTLTQNIMTVKKAWYAGESYNDDACDNKSSAFKTLLSVMALCNDSIKQKDKFLGDPTETALSTFAFGYGISREALEKTSPRTYEIPFDSHRKKMSTICGDIMYTKGGVDEILASCTTYYDGTKIVELTEQLRQTILEENEKFSSAALRVLAGAYKKVAGVENYQEDDMTFVGFVGMIDPPRPDVCDAVSKCKSAGMRPIMITGDHKDTAFEIARQIGIATSKNEVMTGAMIDKLSKEELAEKVKKISVFARVSPENKVQIVEAFKSLGKIVAMTGDGVNDAPSLKKANIGVGMGITGTDVTKEVANMIVTDDSFSTIVVAVEEGRKIYSNIQKTINFLFACNLCEILVILLGVIFFPSITILSAIQILFINLISDSLPAISLGVEPADKNIMNDKPRDGKKSIFSGEMLTRLCVQCLFQAVIVISAFLIGLYAFNNAQIASTMLFLTINFVQLFFQFTLRCKGSIFKSKFFENKTLLVCTPILALIVLLLALTPLASFFGLVALNIYQWLIVAGLSIMIIPLNEILKLITNSIKKRKNK